MRGRIFYSLYAYVDHSQIMCCRATTFFVSHSQFLVKTVYGHSKRLTCIYISITVSLILCCLGASEWHHIRKRILFTPLFSTFHVNTRCKQGLWVMTGLYSRKPQIWGQTDTDRALGDNYVFKPLEHDNCEQMFLGWTKEWGELQSTINRVEGSLLSADTQTATILQTNLHAAHS